jgi:hypothetical protein
MFPIVEELGLLRVFSVSTHKNGLMLITHLRNKEIKRSK